MKTLALMVLFTVLSEVKWVEAQSSPAADGETPGIAVSFLEFVDSGPGHSNQYRSKIVPSTNWTVLGRRSSSLVPTNITIIDSATGGPAAVLQYTNSTQYPTMVALQSLEYKTEGVWNAAPLPTALGSKPCSTA